MKISTAFFLALLAAGCAASRADTWSDTYRLESMGQYEAAAALLDPVLKKEPASEFALLRRAWLHYLAGNYGDSQSDYRAALHSNPQSLDAQIGLALPLLAQKRWKEASMVAEKALQVAPWNYYAHLRLMVAEEGQQKWQTLLQHTDKLHQRYPADATVLVYRARAQYWLGNKDAARDTYLKVLQRVPGHIEALQYLAGE